EADIILGVDPKTGKQKKIIYGAAFASCRSKNIIDWNQCACLRLELVDGLARNTHHSGLCSVSIDIPLRLRSLPDDTAATAPTPHVVDNPGCRGCRSEASGDEGPQEVVRKKARELVWLSDHDVQAVMVGRTTGISAEAEHNGHPSTVN